jgi:hypothetical protein
MNNNIVKKNEYREKDNGENQKNNGEAKIVKSFEQW